MQEPIENPNEFDQNINPMGQKVGMKQTNWKDSEERQELVSANEKLGTEISDVSDKLGDQIRKGDEELTAEIKETRSSLEDKIKSLSEELGNEISDLSEIINYVSSDVTPENLEKKKVEFIAYQDWATKVNKDEYSSEDELFEAKNVIATYGYDYNVAGFTYYLLSPFAAKIGNLANDTELFEVYSIAMDDLLAEKADIETNLESLEVELAALRKQLEGATDPAVIEELNARIKETEAKHEKTKAELSLKVATAERYMDRDAITNEFVKDLDGSVQWHTDQEAASLEEYKDYLANDVIGFGDIKEYHAKHVAEFKANAEAAKTVLEAAANLPEGEEYPNQGELKAARYFEEQFGLNDDLIAVWSFVNFKDRFDMANFAKEDSYGEYVQDINDRKASKSDIETNLESLEVELAALRKQLEGATDPAVIEELNARIKETEAKHMKTKEELTIITSELTKYACYDDVSADFEVCESGYVKWDNDDEARKDELYRTDLEQNVIGFHNSGEYFEKLRVSFIAAAESAKTVIEASEKAIEAGEPYDEHQYMAATWFRDQFGFIANLTAVSMFDDFNDGFNMADFNSETYASYVQDINDRKASKSDVETNLESLEVELAALRKQLEGATDPAEIEELNARIKETEAKVSKTKEELGVITSELEKYTCKNDVTGDREVCESGYVYHAIVKHDDEEFEQREKERRELGWNPDVSVPTLDSSRDAMKARLETSKEIVANPDSHEVEEVLRAQAYLDVVGDSVSVVSHQMHLNIVHEEEKALQETNEAIAFAETLNRMASQISEQGKVISFESMDTYPLPDGTPGQSFEIQNPHGKNFEVISFEVNGLPQTEGVEYTFDGDSITIDPEMSLPRGTQIEVRVKIEEEIEISPIEPNFAEYDFEGEAFCVRKNYELTDMKLDSKEITASKKSSEQIVLSHGEKVMAFSTETASFEAEIANATKAKEDEQVSLDKTNDDLAIAKTSLDEESSKLANAENEVRNLESQIASGNETIALNKESILSFGESIKEEEAKPYPDATLIAELEDQIKTLEASNEAMEVSIAGWTKSKGDVESEVVLLVQAVADLTKEVDALTAQVSKSEAFIAKVTSDIDFITLGLNRVAYLLQIYSDVKKKEEAKIVSYDESLAEITKKIKEFESELSRLKCIDLA